MNDSSRLQSVPNLPPLPDPIINPASGRGISKTTEIAAMPATPESGLVGAVKASEIKEFMHELKLMARSLLAGEKSGHSLAPTMLVHTAYCRNTVRKEKWHDLTWANRQFFFADMVREMRRELIQRIRRQRTHKRPPLVYFSPDQMPVDFGADIEIRPERQELLYEALQYLEDPKPAGGGRPEVVQLINYHYFMGMTTNEIGMLLEISEKTVDRKLSGARILIAETMGKLSGEHSGR